MSRRKIALLVMSGGGALAAMITGSYLVTVGGAAVAETPTVAASAVLATLPPGDRPRVSVVSTPGDVSPKAQTGKGWLAISSTGTERGLDSSIERALYGNWLGEVVASAVQGRLLQNAGVGLAGTTIDATAVEDSTIGDDSAGEIPLGTPDPAAYVFPATGLDATDISNGMRSRAASAGVAVKSLDVLSLGAFSAVAVVVRTTTGPTESAADWFSIANELLPASLHDNLVGYYLALEDNTGSPLRINTAGYLADVTTTWVRPDVMAGAGLIAQPVTG